MTNPTPSASMTQKRSFSMTTRGSFGGENSTLHELPANHSRDPFTPLGESSGDRVSNCRGRQQSEGSFKVSKQCKEKAALGRMPMETR
ncbi:hypothetical protein TNCV_1839331 [Trichonephila clavipes]|nr:hypothetical protein TNCV_1839331 [Trichonephila clavipes]